VGHATKSENWGGNIMATKAKGAKKGKKPARKLGKKTTLEAQKPLMISRF
jgi:hypothetical protein